MLVNINVFFCFTTTTAFYCNNMSMQNQFAIGMSEEQYNAVRQSVITTRLLQQQHINATSKCHWNVKVAIQRL